MEEADAEIERLQAHSKSMIDALNADIDAKHAEIERLRAALRGLMLDHEWKSIDKDNMEYQVRVNCYTRNKLLAALEPKP